MFLDCRLTWCDDQNKPIIQPVEGETIPSKSSRVVMTTHAPLPTHPTTVSPPPVAAAPGTAKPPQKPGRPPRHQKGTPEPTPGEVSTDSEPPTFAPTSAPTSGDFTSVHGTATVGSSIRLCVRRLFYRVPNTPRRRAAHLTLTAVCRSFRLRAGNFSRRSGLWHRALSPFVCSSIESPKTAFEEKQQRWWRQHLPVLKLVLLVFSCGSFGLPAFLPVPLNTAPTLWLSTWKQYHKYSFYRFRGCKNAVSCFSLCVALYSTTQCTTGLPHSSTRLSISHAPFLFALVFLSYGLACRERFSFKLSPTHLPTSQQQTLPRRRCTMML